MKLQLHDLRVGNYYKTKLGVFKWCVLDWKELIEGDIALDDISGVELTEEMLVDGLGFEIKNKQYSLNVGNELHRYAIKDRFVIWDSNGSGYLKMKQQGGGWLLKECYSRNDVVYKYLNQLQDLFYSLENKILTLKEI